MRTVARRAVAVAALTLGASAWTPYAAAEPVDLGGQALPGGAASTDPANPTLLTAGLWSDTLGTGTGSAHQFVYERQMEESTVHIGVVAASTDPDGDGVGLLVSAGETDCGSNIESASSYADHGVFGTSVHVGPADPGDHQSECLRAPRLAIVVDRGYSSSTSDLPVAIKVVEEAPVVDLDPEDPGLPEPETEVRYEDPAGAATEDLSGGTSFDDATDLDPSTGGVTVSTEVAEGGEVLLRVPVDWDQQVVASARVPGMDAATEELTGGSGPYVDLRILDPVRDLVGDPRGEATTTGSYGIEPVDLSRGTLPLRYLNLFAGQEPQVPGDFWVAFAVDGLAADAGREPLAVPVELTVAVVGETAGGPEHRATVQAPGGGAGPDGYAPEAPYLVGDGEFSGVASGNPFRPPGEDDEGWWGPRRGVGMGLGVLSLGCCAVGAVWLVRRRAS